MPQVEVLAKVSDRDVDAAPVRSVRRGLPAALAPRAIARRRQGDRGASLIDFWSSTREARWVISLEA